MNKLFLLSIEEYKQYKELIPNAGDWWWLRTPGTLPCIVSIVYTDGTAVINGAQPFYDYTWVRPAFKSKKLASNFDVGDRYCSKDNLWIYLGDDIFISKYLVKRSKFDSLNKDYKTSFVKNVILKDLEDELFTIWELANIEDWEE